MQRCNTVQIRHFTVIQNLGCPQIGNLCYSRRRNILFSSFSPPPFYAPPFAAHCTQLVPQMRERYGRDFRSFFSRISYSPLCVLRNTLLRPASLLRSQQYFTYTLGSSWYFIFRMTHEIAFLIYELLTKKLSFLKSGGILF